MKNNKLKIYYSPLPVFIERTDEKIDELDKIIKMLKKRFSIPYHKAKIKASKLNKLEIKILSGISSTRKFYAPSYHHRNKFIKLYRIAPFCEGCKKEPIQCEAHIIKQSKGKSNRALKKFIDHYANIWLLCGTCHSIVDGKGCTPSKERINRLLKNLKKRASVQRKMYEVLKKDKNDIKRWCTKFKGILRTAKISEERAIIELKEILNEEKIMK